MQSSYERDNDDEKTKAQTTNIETGTAVIPDGVDIQWSSNVIFDANNNNQIIGNDIGRERLYEKINIQKKDKSSSSTTSSLNKYILRRIYNAMQSEYKTTFLRVETNPTTKQTIYTKLQLNDVTSLLAQIDTTSSSSSFFVDSAKPMSLDIHSVPIAESITPASHPATSSSLNIPTDMECDDNAPAAATATVVVKSEAPPKPVVSQQRPLTAYNLYFLLEKQRILNELDDENKSPVLLSDLPSLKPGVLTEDVKKLQSERSAYTLDDITTALDRSSSSNNNNNNQTKKDTDVKMSEGFQQHRQQQKSNSKIAFQKLTIEVAKRWRLVCSEDERQLFHNYSKRFKQQQQQ